MVSKPRHLITAATVALMGSGFGLPQQTTTLTLRKGARDRDLLAAVPMYRERGRSRTMRTGWAEYTPKTSQAKRRLNARRLYPHG